MLLIIVSNNLVPNYCYVNDKGELGLSHFCRKGHCEKNTYIENVKSFITIKKRLD